MVKKRSVDYETLANRVKTSLQRAEKQTRELRKTNRRLLVAGVIASALATLIAGVTAASGPVVGEGIPGWRLACSVAAIFSFAGTIAVGLNQQLGISDRLAEGTQCVGRLRFLDLAIDTRSRDWEEITEEYEAIVTTYPQML